MYVITAHQRHGRTDGRTSSDPMTATLLKHVAVKSNEIYSESVHNSKSVSLLNAKQCRAAMARQPSVCFRPYMHST